MNGLIDSDFILAKNEDIHEHYTRHRAQRPTSAASKDSQGKTTTNLPSFYRLKQSRI